MTPQPATLRPAVFFDRDGTLTEEVGYVNHPSRLRLIRGTAAAVRLCNENGLLAIVVTNQAGVARGYFEESMIRDVHARLRELLVREGARLDAIYYCPHHPREGKPPYRADCNCRKPRPGMIEQAAREHPIDLARSYMVGDKISDSQFGRRLGLRTVMVMTGYGLGEYEFQREDWDHAPDHLARNTRAAVKWILRDLARQDRALR